MVCTGAVFKKYKNTPVPVICWDKSVDFSCGATRLDALLRPLCAYYHMLSLLTKFILRRAYLILGFVRFALRSPFGSAFTCCHRTIGNSLICKHPCLLTLPQRFKWYLIFSIIALRTDVVNTFCKIKQKII